jgi:biopolymer transport protein ExbD
MAGGARSGGDDDLITDINVTPLVDVVLVLLIILMVTATAIVSKTIPMELPKASTGEQTPTTLAVSIDQSGQVFVDTIPVTTEELRARVRVARESDEDLRAVIAADGRIAHAKVVQVIDVLRQERVTKFAINVRPEEIGR